MDKNIQSFVLCFPVDTFNFSVSKPFPFLVKFFYRKKRIFWTNKRCAIHTRSKVRIVNISETKMVLIRELICCTEFPLVRAVISSFSLFVCQVRINGTGQFSSSCLNWQKFRIRNVLTYVYKHQTKWILQRTLRDAGVTGAKNDFSHCERNSRIQQSRSLKSFRVVTLI